MEHKKTLLGLKAAPPKLILDESEDEGSFFNDDNSDLLQLPLQTSQTRLPIVDSPEENLQNPLSNRIKSFDEILPRISQITNAFEDQNSLPTQYKGDIYFIPEHIVNDDFSRQLNTFIQSTDPDAEFHFPEQEETTEIHPNIYAQIDIIKYSKNQKVDLLKYTSEGLDSRILSLIYFILSKQEDREISCFYCTQSLIELIKTFEFAPISILFQDYTIKYIFHQLSISLVTLFPHHPLLESILHKFSSYDPEALDTLALLPNDTTESDSFDDDFFADIQAVQCQKPTIKLNDIFNDSILINPLDNYQPVTQNVVTVTINEPPSTLTYHFFDGSTQQSPTMFSKWIQTLSIQSQKLVLEEPPMYELPNSCDNVSGSVPKQETFLSATTPTVSYNLPIKIDSPQDVDKNLLLNLIQYIDRPNTLLSYLSYFPNSLDLQLFPYLFPLLQSVNTTAVTPLKKGCIYPKLIVHEFDAYQTLLNGKQDKIIEVINDMAKKVPPDSQRAEIKPLENKRHFPTTETPCPENIVAIISLSDIEIVLNGRSPLTFERIFRDSVLNSPFERDWRAEVLYHFYSTQELPPYISFRVAFALALNLSETQTERIHLAADIIFEGLYGLLNALPKMTSSECVRSSFLFFAELLDRLDRYYYSAQLLDAYFLGNTSYQTSSQISSICQHRNDMVRSVFHLNQTMNYFIQTNKGDEALYVSQVISSIYDEFGLYYNSISLLTYLLRKTYSLSVGRSIQKVSVQRTKTMPPVRQFPVSNKVIFAPSPSGTNTLLSGISLATLLVKCRFFKLSKELLDALKKSSNNKLYLRLIEFVSSKRLLKKNKFIDFLNSLPPLIIRQKRSSAGSRLTSFSASTFDTVIALIKMLMTGYLNRNLLGQSIFWCEVILNTQTKFNLKDIGAAFLIRGECFLRYRLKSNVTNGLLSVHVPLNQAMSNVGEYRDNHIFQNQTEITQEAIASFKAARICFEKVGCQLKMLTASILYTSVILQHFIDELGYLNEEPLEITNPRLETKSKNSVNQQAVTFEPYTITLQNLEEHLSMLCQSIETITSRLMNPLLIIFSEIVVSKFNLFQKNLTSSKKRFEFAYTNFKKHFSCGGYVLIQDLSLNFVRIVHLILEYMCQLLLLFDQEFINNHLLVFDWFNDCTSYYEKMTRVIQPENTEPIDASINVSMYALQSMQNLQLPDFFETLDESHAEINRDPPYYKETLQSYLLRINSNIKLHELQKLSESQLHENNRYLIRQIETLADSYRHDHPNLIPPEMDYSFSVRPPSIAYQAVFVQLIFDGIYVYVPSSGEKRYCPLIPASNQSVTQFRSHAFSYPKSMSIPQLISEAGNNESSEYLNNVQNEDSLLNSSFNNLPNKKDKTKHLSPSLKAESAPASMSPLDKLSVFETYSENGADLNDKSILLGEPYSDDDTKNNANININDNNNNNNNSSSNNSQGSKKEKSDKNNEDKAKNTKNDEKIDDEQKQKMLQKELQEFINKYSTSFTVSVKKIQDQVFTSTSGLFSNPLFEYIAYLILPDRSNKKFTSTNISQRTRLKFAQKLKKQLFGDINLEKSIGAEEWVKKPDKQVFYNIKASTNKGTLETIHKSPRPIVLVASNSLKSIPFELLFPTQLVLRCWNYAQLILPGKLSTSAPNSATSSATTSSIPIPSLPSALHANNASILTQNLESEMDSDSFDIQVSKSFGTLSSARAHRSKSRKSESSIEFDKSNLNLDNSDVPTYNCNEVHSPTSKNPAANTDSQYSTFDGQALNFENSENSKSYSKHKKSNADSPTPYFKNKKPSPELESAIIECENKMASRHTPTNPKKKKIPLPREDSKISSTPKPSRSSSLSVVPSQSTPLLLAYQYGIGTVLIRKRSDFEISTIRSLDLLKSIIINCGGAFRTAPEFVSKYERASLYMFPAFLSGKETSYYQQKYPFCCIYEHENINEELNMNSTLFLFSYADMCENHETLRKLSIEYPSSFFMFIPGQVFKEALKAMKLIFERQKKRKAFTLGKKDESYIADHVRLSKVPYEFITSLQLTLSNALNCPIPLIGLP